MVTLYAKDYGINPNEEITEKLSSFIEMLKNITEDKTIVFESGNYYIDSMKCKQYRLFITNTVGDDEFSTDETPHIAEVPFFFEKIKNLVFDGNSSSFFIDGKATNMVFENCENVTVKNLSLFHTHPDMHEITVKNITENYVDFELDRDTLYKEMDGEFCFYGNNFFHPFMKYSHSGWIGLVKKDNLNCIVRVYHPFRDAKKIEEIAKSLFRVYFDNTSRYDLEDRFYVYDVRRQYVGIFVEKSKDITLENFKQHFNYSLAYVAQNCENLYIKNSVFAPGENAPHLMCSAADFLQICMCRGDFLATGNIFVGAGDDCMNVHGVHFKINKIKENSITVEFSHPQTHGFNPLRKGDEIAYINPETMLEEGRAKIVSSTLLNENQIELEVTYSDSSKKGYSIENVSACPDVYFANNTINRIITRGVLITNRNKTVIENNRFVSCSLSGVLLSDDASSWYESGMCRNVEIKNNIFEYCGDTPILIKPENVKHKGAVHKGIVISDNEFLSYENECIYAKSAENIEISGNKFLSDGFLKTKNCTNIKIRQ